MNSLLMTVLGLLCILGCHGLSLPPRPAPENSEQSVENQKEPASPVEIIAHRGASYDAPENTLASVKLAWEQHADAVEIFDQFAWRLISVFRVLGQQLHDDVLEAVFDRELILLWWLRIDLPHLLN